VFPVLETVTGPTFNVDNFLSNCPGNIRVGCAGWSISKDSSSGFPVKGTHLSRFSARLPAVEINTSFYRPHLPATYARWAESVPVDFQFAVKIPKAVTHDRRLVDVNDLLDRFLGEATCLGGKLGPLLVQIPPSLSFSAAIAESFFFGLRSRYEGHVAVEPRHESWFEPVADQLLTKFRVARVAADPQVVPTASEPGGWTDLVYYRLHGTPKRYYSAYSADYIASLATNLMALARSAEVWCIFDNTATGAATANALALFRLLKTPSSATVDINHGKS
jgi:uncharacterized protein YecE (DUF72 family)